MTAGAQAETAPVLEPGAGSGSGPRRRWTVPPWRRARRRVKTPTVLQMEAVECGAAALAMVLAYFGRYVPLEELRTACGVSRDGSKAANVLRAARRYGLTAKGMQMDVEHLVSARPPAILFWKFNHFVVFEGRRRLGKPAFFLNDPGSGRRKVSFEELDGCFTGIAMLFDRGPEFQPGGKPVRVIDDLRARRPGTVAAMLIVLVASLLLVACGLAVPAFTRVFVDTVLTNGDQSIVPPLLASMLVVLLLLAGLTAIQQTFLLRAELMTSIVSAARFVRHLLRLPIVFFTQRNAADITRRVSSNDLVAEVLSRDVASAAINAFLVVVYAVLLYLRRAADPHRRVDVAAEHRGAALGVAGPQGRGVQAPRRPRQPGGHLLQRPAADRDDEGDRRRERLLPPLGRLPGQGGLRPAADGDAERDPVDRGTAAGHAAQRADPAGRRLAGDIGASVDRPAGRLPGPGHQLHPAGHPAHQPGPQDPGPGRRRDQAARRGALPGRAGVRDPGPAHRPPPRRPPRVRRRHLRLQPPGRPAAQGVLLPDRPGPADRLGRRVGQRQVHRQPPGRWPVRALG